MILQNNIGNDRSRIGRAVIVIHIFKKRDCFFDFRICPCGGICRLRQIRG